MEVEISKSKTNFFVANILFFVWPFFAFVYSLINYRSKYAKNIVWFFCIFIGFTIVLPDRGADHDMNRYRALFESYNSKADQPFWDVFTDEYDDGVYSSADIYTNLLTLSVSRFTDNFRIFLGLVALIYGYFLSRNLFFIVELGKNKRLGKVALMLFITLLFIYTLWDINGYRFVTAAVIFLYGILRYLVFRKKKYLFFIVLAPLIHFTFVIPIIVMFIYLLVGNRLNIYGLLLLGSMFLVDINPSSINESAELAPIFLQGKIRGYTNKDYIKYVAKSEVGNNWYVKGHILALNFMVYGLILFAWLKRKVFMEDKAILSLFSFGVLLLAAANAASSIPSMGRFNLLAFFVLISSFLYLLMNYKFSKLEHYWMLIALPFLMFLIVKVRIGLDAFGFNTLLFNLGTAPFLPDFPGIMDYIK